MQYCVHYFMCHLHGPSCIHFDCSLLIVYQVSVLADDILKNVEYDALRIVFNKFQSVVQFIPTVSTILSPEVILDSYHLAVELSNFKCI